MKKLLSVQMYLFIAVIIFSNAAYAKDVTVSGTVKEFATGQPVDLATVILFEGSMDMSSIPDTVDTVFSASDGTFEKLIVVNDNATILVYGVYKEGFLAKSDMETYFLTPMPTEIDLGDILLKTIADATDTLTVKGSVIDSITREPIPGATIRVTTGVIGDITIDSLTTDAQGIFEEKIPYIPSTNNLFKIMLYSAMKDEYTSKGDTASIPDNEMVDLGVIELVEVNIAIKLPLKKLMIQQPTHIAVYSMNGKLIYEGRINNQNIFKNIMTSNQQVIIRYYRNNKLLGVIKNLHLKQ